MILVHLAPPAPYQRFIRSPAIAYTFCIRCLLTYDWALSPPKEGRKEGGDSADERKEQTAAFFLFFEQRRRRRALFPPVRPRPSLSPFGRTAWRTRAPPPPVGPMAAATLGQKIYVGPDGTWSIK